MREQTFTDRVQAGKLLGAKLKGRRWASSVVVVALPRGGVPVGAQVADALQAPLDVLVVRKIGAPAHEELACGAIAPNGVVVWNDDVLRSLGISSVDLTRTVQHEETELKRRESAIRSRATPAIMLAGKSVVLVDDGIATGATMRAAIRALKTVGAKEIVIGLPVGPSDTCSEIQHDESCVVECLRMIPAGSFGSVGEWYDDFSQVETEECRRLLEANRGVSSKQQYAPQ